MEKKPFLTEAMAQEIIQDVPTPFHVYDEKGIRENARRINKAFSWNKGFKEYFAVKALPNPVILQILKEEGCGVDCSSLTELMLSEVCGFSGSEIMFSSNQTPVEDMKKAYELGAYINLDDATMVEFLERVAGVPENIFCRYNPGGTFSLGESEEGFQVMDKPGDAKYGMTEEQMIESYKKLAAKGAKNFGIHAFLASNTISDEYYPELAGILFQLAVRVQKATGVHIGYINLSGGVGIPYRPEQTENDDWLKTNKFKKNYVLNNFSLKFFIYHGTSAVLNYNYLSVKFLDIRKCLNKHLCLHKFLCHIFCAHNNLHFIFIQIYLL